MQRLPGLVRTVVGGGGGTGGKPMLRSQLNWLLGQKATVCSACSAVIRQARLQNLQQQLEKAGGLSEILHHYPRQHQLLLLPWLARRLQRTALDIPNKALLTTLTRLFSKDAGQDGQWGYTGENGPDSWAKMYPTCGGTSQSPVNINTNATCVDDTLTPFTFLNFDSVQGIDWVIQNNGHSAQVTYDDGDVFVAGGGLSSKFKVAQFHFHWGADDSTGSEHTVDREHAPMEMHIVMYNTDYTDMGTAVNFEDGLAVLGSFFKVDSVNNTNFDGVINSLALIREGAGPSVSIPPLKLGDLLPENTDAFFRYKGSLTTPPCSEVVTWTLFRNCVRISSAQLEEFRKLKNHEGEPLVNNFRPTQPLNGRTIYTNRNFS